MKLRYPIYIPSKGRYDKPYTTAVLKKDDVPFRVVVEPQEQYSYAAAVGEENVLVLPFSDQGSVIPARNWIIDHAISEGHKRHWQLDDNIRSFMRWYRQRRVRCSAALALFACEEFTDRYENVAISGLNYSMFAAGRLDPFILNCRVYSCSLILNEIPHRFRGRYNEDADICLQVLADGWCTILMNAFLSEKMWTMILKGGNTDEIYRGDGRARMARELERRWPGVVKVKRRFQRPQHVVYDGWKRFDNKLIRRKDIDWDNLKNPIKMKMVKVDKIKAPAVQKLYEEHQERKD